MSKDLYLPENILSCIHRLNAAGYEAFTVGGAVRDSLLERPTHDYDITTNALPEETKQVFQGEPVIETGIAHGTVTVLMNHEPVEITTYRTETTYTDHRHPDGVHFTSSLQEDCARRDFTINALAYNPATGIQDFFHGTEDLKQQIIRCVGEPDRRFEEDALRILRGIRFMAQLGFRIEENTAAAIHTHREQLHYVSMERITAEFLKTLEAEYCSRALHDFRDVMEVFLPEIKPLLSGQWQLIIAYIDHLPRDAALRMAYLLHPVKDTLPQNFFRRLKLSNSFHKDCIQYMESTGIPLHSRIDLRHLLGSVDVPFEHILALRAVLEPGLNTNQLRDEYHGILERHDCIRIAELAITGKDVMALGITGPSIRAALEEALNAVMEERCENTREALTSFLQNR